MRSRLKVLYPARVEWSSFRRTFGLGRAVVELGGGLVKKGPWRSGPDKKSLINSDIRRLRAETWAERLEKMERAAGAR